jgi:hypothetical protein
MASYEYWILPLGDPPRVRVPSACSVREGKQHARGDGVNGAGHGEEPAIQAPRALTP